jgi:hypothetical protein
LWRNAQQKEKHIRRTIPANECGVATVAEHLAALLKLDKDISFTGAETIPSENHLVIEIASEAAPAAVHVKQHRNSVQLMASALLSMAQLVRHKTGLNSGVHLVDVRLLTSDMAPLKVTTTHNLFVAFLGERGLRVSAFSREHWKLGILFYVCWLLGFVLGVLSLFHVLPVWISVLSALLMLPFISLNVGYLITDIAVLLLYVFDSWYICANVLVALIAMCVMVNDVRAVFLLGGVLVSML